MQLFHGREIAGRKFFRDFGNDDAVVIMGEEVAVVKHVDPDLGVGDDPGRGSLAESFSRGHRSDAQPRVFEKFPRGFPGDVQAIFEPAESAFFFQRTKSFRSARQGLAQEEKTAREVLELSCPASIDPHDPLTQARTVRNL